MNKREIISKLVAKVSDGVLQMAEAAEGARQASIASPGRNLSRYDSSKEENGYLADGLNMRAMSIRRDLFEIGGVIIPDTPGSVVLGALVRVYGQGNTPSHYLLLPSCGGEFIEDGEREIDVVTPESPIGQAMMGKRVGETFDFEVRGRKQSYRVDQIE